MFKTNIYCFPSCIKMLTWFVAHFFPVFRGETHSPPNRMFYLTADNGPWATSSLPRGVSHITNLPGFHGYQDSVVSSGRGSMFEGRETGDQYGSSSRGLDDSSYGTLEDRHKKSGSRDSLDQAAYGMCIVNLILFGSLVVIALIISSH